MIDLGDVLKMGMDIKFSPPDITNEEIIEVINALKSGWITTGPKTKKLEEKIAGLCNTERAVCLNSATAGLELVLRLWGIGPGDEVITSAYTYTASCSVICHVGATPVLVDTQKDSLEMDYDALEKAITEETKAIIPVDIAGIMCDYEKIFEIVNSKKSLFKANNDLQKKLGRVLVLADAAHSFGAKYKDKPSGSVADFTSFSFHAVKNFTTAEGGAVVWKNIEGISNDDIYKEFMLLSLHGQSKDALAKSQKGSWEYDIVYPGYKCNMTDIMAAIGLAQFRRYKGLLAKRKNIIERYNEAFKDLDVTFLNHYDKDHSSSGHLYIIRLNGKDVEQRNNMIKIMAESGIATNVHYKPLPMHTAYKNLGFDIKDFPNAYNLYKNSMTLPLHTLLSKEEVEYIIKIFKESLGKI